MKILNSGFYSHINIDQQT